MNIPLKRPLMVVDLETTNANVNTARIVQIAYQRYSHDGISLRCKRYNHLVNPESIIDPGAIETHHITPEMVQDQPTFADLAPKLINDFMDTDFAGYNVGFDLQILINEFRKLHMGFNSTQASIIDGYKLWIRLRPRTLSDAIEYWAGRKPQDAHDAAADVHMTSEIIQAQYEDIQNKRLLEHDPSKTIVEQLSELSFPNRVDLSGKFIRDDDGEIIFNFSQNKGAKAKSNPGFLRWMLRNDFPLETKLWVRNILKELQDG